LFFIYEELEIEIVRETEAASKSQGKVI
jgi:hypothetical protein